MSPTQTSLDIYKLVLFALHPSIVDSTANLSHNLLLPFQSRSNTAPWSVVNWLL